MSGTAMTCGKCGADVAHAKRMKDSKGRYFCELCAAALRQRAAEKLGQPVDGSVQAAPAGVQISAPAMSAATPQPEDGTFALADEPARPVARPTVGLGNLQICPDCGHPLGADHDICAGCGFNRKTGHHIGRGNVVTDAGGGGTLPASKHVPKPCKKCGYDMTGTKTGRCPECGTINTRMLSAKQTESQTLKSMFVGPAIMIGIGLTLAVVAYFIRGWVTNSGGLVGGAGYGGWYLAYYAVSVVVGFGTYIGCSVMFVGFDEPLGVTFVRLAGVYAVTDAVSAVLGSFLPGFVAWPILAVVYLGLLMQVMELDWEDAWLVGAITYIVHVVVSVAMWYVWMAYF